jgi:hypothetical protein
MQWSREQTMPTTSTLLEQAKNMEHLAGVTDGLWNQLRICFPPKVEQLSNQIFTHCLSLFPSILIME